MKKLTLLKNLGELGYPLFKTEESFDANKTLAEVVKSKETRFLEGFPILLATSLEKELFDYKDARKHLERRQDRENLKNLVLMSLALYKYLKLKLPYVEHLYNYRQFNEKLAKKYLDRFKKNQMLTESGKQLSSSRVINTFKNYFRHAEPNFKDYVKMREEFDLEYALSQLFSKKQKELFLKKLRGEKMRKTEQEYYSRSVKKKALALANSDLHGLATKLVQE